MGGSGSFLGKKLGRNLERRSARETAKRPTVSQKMRHTSPRTAHRGNSDT